MRNSVIKSKLMSALLAIVLLLPLIPASVYSAADTGTMLQPEKKPDQPVMAELSVIPTVGNNGHAVAVILESSIANAIIKAQGNARVQGKSANGLGAALNVNLPETANSIGIVLTQDVLKSLVNSEVKQLKVNGSILALDLDLEAVKEIQKQSRGDVTITMVKSPVGTSQEYHITISYVDSGKKINITNIGRGTATVSFPGIKGENAAPFIPGGYGGQQNDKAAPFIPGGRSGQ